MSRRFIVVLVLLVALVGVATFFIFHRQQKVDRLYSRLTSNVQSAGLINNEMYYFTGSFFAKYNFSERKIIQLSDWLDIKNGVENVSWDANAVVFSSKPSPGTRDDISTASSQLGVDPNTSHWWRYDFGNKQYQLLDFATIDACSALVQMNQEKLFCLQKSGETSTVTDVYMFDVAARSGTKIFTTNNTVDRLSAYDGNFGFVVTTLGGKQSVYQGSASSGKSREIYTAKGDVAYKLGNDGSILISDTQIKIEGQNTHEEDSSKPVKDVNYRLYVMQGGKITEVGGVKSPGLTLYRNGALFASSLDGSIYQLKGGVVERIADPSTETEDYGSFIFEVGGESLLLQDSVLSTEDVVELNSRDPSEFNGKDDNDPTGNSWIDNSVDPFAVYLYLPNIPSSKQQALVGQHLTSKGFVPAEFNFTWVVDGVDFHTPIQPNAVIIR